MLSKIETVKRLIKNRLRFKDSAFISKYSDKLVLVELDPNCLCGLEPGDGFDSKRYQYRIIEMLGTVYLAAKRIL